MLFRIDARCVFPEPGGPNTLTIRDTVSTSVMILLTLIVEVLILDIVAMIPLHLYSISDSVIPISSAIIRSKLRTLNLNCSTDTDSWIALNNDLTLSVDLSEVFWEFNCKIRLNSESTEDKPILDVIILKEDSGSFKEWKLPYSTPMNYKS